jgi:putative ribosome biogenesis GTPase RsgA
VIVAYAEVKFRGCRHRRGPRCRTENVFFHRELTESRLA